MQQGAPHIFVAVEGYPETEIPLKFSSLRLWVEQPALSFDAPVQVMVHAAGGETQAKVTGRVKINNTDIEATDSTFSFTSNDAANRNRQRVRLSRDVDFLAALLSHHKDHLIGIV